MPGYAASKGGIGQLTMAFANEWAGSGVNVNAIARGYIATDNTRALRDDPVRSERFSRASRRVDGANRMTSKDLSCSSHRMPPNTSTAQRCSAMEAGWAGNALDNTDSIAT